MRKYLHKFESLDDFKTSYDGSDYHEPWTSLTVDTIPTKIQVTYGGTTYVLEYIGEVETTEGGGV